MISTVVVFLLILLSGFFKGKSDTIAHDDNVQKNEWTNKWKSLDWVPKSVRSKPYLGLYTPEFQEAFWYSSTILVWMTDPWHRYNFYQYRCIDAAICITAYHVVGWWCFCSLLVLPISRALGFYRSYKKSSSRGN